ncbi:hypothetical protein ACIQGZ_02430 [Streptomyces sp. NPDC092296]|uniref:hypothetical protein n=1 Tax=Streptomyces sp. NPDC092296 TaxID=3366012 RepID=UPI0038222EB5
MAEQSRSGRDRVRRRHSGTAAEAGGPAEDGRIAEPPAGEEAPAGGATPEDRAESDAERRRRRAAFLHELAEARELRARVHPRRTKERRMREAARMRTFRF